MGTCQGRFDFATVALGATGEAGWALVAFNGSGMAFTSIDGKGIPSDPKTGEL
jgi:hypothetical protein